MFEIHDQTKEHIEFDIRPYYYHLNFMGALHVLWKAPVFSWDGKDREKISKNPIRVEKPSHPTKGGFSFINFG